METKFRCYPGDRTNGNRGRKARSLSRLPGVHLDHFVTDDITKTNIVKAFMKRQGRRRKRARMDSQGETYNTNLKGNEFTSSDPAHILTHCFCKISFNIILTPTLVPHKWLSVPFRFSD
jgi:hypothetical protein